MTERGPRLRQFAERVRDDSSFLASALEPVRRHRGWRDAELAAHLGGDEDQLARLRLCRPPRTDRWAADVELIATLRGVDAGRLAGLLRGAPPG